MYAIRSYYVGAGVAPEAMAAGNGEILQLALAAFVADRAVIGGADHQPFETMLPHGHVV